MPQPENESRKAGSNADEAGVEALLEPAAQCPDTAIEAGWILTVDEDNTILERHALLLCGEQIAGYVALHELERRYPGILRIDRRSSILMPGLVNAHTHLAMNLLRGFADDLPLMRWLEEHIWPTEGRHMAPDYVRDGTELALAECLLGGVTTVNDMYFFPNVVADTCESVGVRAMIGLLVFDFPTAWADSVDRYFERGLELYDVWRGHPRIRTAFAPHAPYTVSRRPLERIAMLSAELDLPVHMHVHETAGEVQSFLATEGVRPLQRLDDIGLVNPLLLAVHLTQLTEKEIELLGERKVQALHCPESNLKLASGFCPVARLAAAGVRVAIGTDGAASNNDIDLLGELRTAALLAKAVAQDAAALDATSAIRMATIDGARVLGIDAQTGSLVPGKSADLIAIEPDITMLPMYDPAAQIVYATGRERIRDVWVAGRQLLANRVLTSIDLDAVTARTRRWEERIRSGRFGT